MKHSSILDWSNVFSVFVRVFTSWVVIYLSFSIMKTIEPLTWTPFSKRSLTLIGNTKKGYIFFSIWIASFFANKNKNDFMNMSESSQFKLKKMNC